MLQKNEDFGCARAWYKLVFQAVPLKLQGSFLQVGIGYHRLGNAMV